MVVMGSTAGAFPVFSADVLPFAKEPAICGQFKQRMQSGLRMSGEME
jgi:hypothetical protein